MIYANIVLSIVLGGALYLIYRLNKKVNVLLDRVTAASYAVAELKKGVAAALAEHEKKNSEDMKELHDRMKEFEEAGLENLRAQAAAEKAFADGVQEIMGFGANIPKLKTGGLKNE